MGGLETSGTNEKNEIKQNYHRFSPSDRGSAEMQGVTVLNYIVIIINAGGIYALYGYSLVGQKSRTGMEKEKGEKDGPRRCPRARERLSV